MILSSFGFKEANWELTGLSPLNPENLVVGRNSTGKTRTISSIRNVVSFLQMKDLPLGPKDFSTELTFTDEMNGMPWTMIYGFSVKDGIIVKENLKVCGKNLIKRTKASAKYDGKTVNPPSGKLIVQIRRDKDAYPEIEKLMTWAEGIICITCSDITPITALLPVSIYSPIPLNEVVDKLTDADKKVVLKRAKEVGFNLMSINTIKVSDMKLVEVKEKGISEHLVNYHLSSGMLRTVYILCFLEFIKHYDGVSMLMIDDLGEGLDYGRSTHLGRMVFEDCKNSNLQLIASSNDAFLMDVVDINNWQVLRRNVSKVTSINHANNPDMFRKFRMTGLANFDFFSSDFIDKYLYKQSQEAK